MPRIRTIKPEIWLSAQVMNLSHSARLLFIGLITQADDDGYGSSDPRKLKASVFGGDDLTIDVVKQLLAEIEAQRLVLLYEADGYGALYWLPSWKEHQYVQKAVPTRYPPPVDKSLPERYRNATVGSDRIGSDRKGSDARAGAGARRAPEARGPGPGAPGNEEALTDAEVAARRKAAEDNLRTLRRAGIEPPTPIAAKAGSR